MAAFQTVYRAEAGLITDPFWLLFQLLWLMLLVFGFAVAICRDHGWLDKKPGH